ncbi:MAG: hypothetical protein KJZ70_10770 [Bryobacterales bacterium]|nr:hypothetical protein [Bryobacterales bacterium]
MGKLNTADIKDYLEIHLPVRVRTLLAHYRMTHERGTESDSRYTGDLGQLEACYLASLVSGRILLNLVGIGIAKDGQGLVKFRFHGSDVGADDLGGSLVSLPLPETDEELLGGLLRMANKAAAHFTTPERHAWQRSHNAILLVHRYVDRHVYQPNGRLILPIWY